ncbi:MAG: TonB-dependent receptor [Nitrospirota bacterium]
MMRLLISSTHRVRRCVWKAPVLALITVLIGVLPVSAQPTPSEKSGANQSMAFAIPAQPLTSALHAFAETSGLQVSFPSELAAGVSSLGLNGSYTPNAALQLLLSGTGLTHRFTNPSTITLVPESVTPSVLPPPLAQSQVAPSDFIHETGEGQQSKPIKVPEVVVKEVRERGYVAEEASSATRIPAPIQDIPRSIEVVTRQVMEDQKVIRMSDALRNVSGTSQSTTQGGRAGEFMIRGFASTLNVFKNGFRDDSTFGSRGARDAINLESIEVVKGPPSYLYGRSDPGGLINQITKAPLKDPYYAAEMIVGSYNLYRPTIDIGGPLNESKTLTYRFNGMHESAQSYREGVKSDRVFLAPTIGWEIGPRTFFRFEGEYLYDKSPIDRGIVAVGNRPASIPIGRFLGDPSRRGEINSGKATLILTHELSDAWKWRSAFRTAASRERYSSLESNVMDDATGILTLARYEIPQTVQSHYWQNELHGAFSTGAVKHKTLFGIELGREHSSSTLSGDFGGFGSFINIFNPNDRFFAPDGTLSKFGDSSQTNNILGAYFGDQIALLDNLHIHAGGRFDVLEQKTTNRPHDFDPNTTKTHQTDTAFSPSVGIAYQPQPWVSVFANYTQSFSPQAVGARSIDGNTFDPERGKSYEGGLKFHTMDGRLRSTLAVFDIKKRNVLTSDPNAGFLFSIATGEQRSRGFEFDVAGQIVPGWDIIANYAYIDARVTKDVLFAEGSRAPNSALHQGSLWTTYFFQEGVVKGFGTGIGMYAQGKRNGIFQCQDPGNCAAPFELPGFVRTDAALYYRKPDFWGRTNLLAAINLTNVLDQRYFTGAQNFREIVYTGAPFTAIASVKFEFH